MKKFNIMILLLFSIVSTFAQRKVIWAHGLGESEVAWSHYEQVFNAERTINSSNPNYNTSSGINYATGHLTTQLSSVSTSPTSNNLAIGHSMGGLVLRNMDRLYNSSSYRKIDGLITVASPNNGAPIIESIDDGDVSRASNNAIAQLTVGPISELGSGVWMIAGIASTSLASLLINNQLNMTGSAGSQVMQDLKPNSIALNNINSYSSTIPRISIYASETSPVQWRLASSALPPSSMLYAANNDETVVQVAAIVRASYEVMRVYNLAFGVACTAGGFFNPGCWGSAAIHYLRSYAWAQGRNWIDNSETIWNTLIKSIRIEDRDFWESVFTPDPYYEECMTYVDEYGGDWYGDCGTFEWQWVTHPVPISYPSDGLLPQYTQELEDLPLENRYEIEGANHIELLNMSASSEGDNTKATFNDIFDRSDWFHTN